MKLRHVQIHDGDIFDLKENRVALDANGHPIVWSVIHSFRGNTTSSDPNHSVWLTYLELDGPTIEEVYYLCRTCGWNGQAPFEHVDLEHKHHYLCPECWDKGRTTVLNAAHKENND